MIQKEKVFSSNMYIQLRKEFNVLQKRTLHFVIKQLQDEMRNLNQQNANGNQIERTLFGDCYFKIPSKLIDPLNQDTAIRRALKSLQIPIATKDTDTFFLMKSTRKDGHWTLLFPEEVVHFLTEVSKGVTPLQTILYLSAKSIYTIRMYELLMQFRDTGKWYTTPEELGDYLSIPLSYQKDYNLFRTRAIETADKELRTLYKEKQSEIYFILTEESGGRGRKVKRLIFTIIWSEKNNQKPQTQEELNVDHNWIIFRLKKIMIDDAKINEKAKIANRKYINYAVGKLVELNKINHFASKLNWILETEKIIEKGAYARTVLKDEYNIELKKK